MRISPIIGRAGGLLPLEVTLTKYDGSALGGGYAYSSVTATVTNGVAPIGYAWSLISGTGDLTNTALSTVQLRDYLDVGSTALSVLQVIVTDGAGRSVTKTVNIEATAPYYPVGATVTGSNGQFAASRTAKATGGKPPYTMTWHSQVWNLEVTTGQTGDEAYTTVTKAAAAAYPTTGTVRIHIVDSRGVSGDEYSTVNLSG